MFGTVFGTVFGIHSRGERGMNELKDKVAVVTGAASGIGLGLAKRFALEGMKVVLADIEDGPLEEAVATIRAAGGSAMADCAQCLTRSDRYGGHILGQPERLGSRRVGGSTTRQSATPRDHQRCL